MAGAPYQLLTAEDVPECWTEAFRKAQNESHDMQCEKLGVQKGTKFDVELVVDLPDYPMMVDYYAWAQRQPPNGCPALLMLSSWRTWKEERPGDLKTTLASLFQKGKPAPIFGLIWHK